VHLDVDEGIDLGNAVPRGLGLEPADIGLAVNDLALQVGLVHDIEIDDAERAHTGRRQVEQRRRTQAARPDDEDTGVLQPLLPGHADLRDDQVTRIALHLVKRQLGGRLDQRWQ
jgi:hypothetical protein